MPPDPSAARSLRLVGKLVGRRDGANDVETDSGHAYTPPTTGSEGASVTTYETMIIVGMGLWIVIAVAILVSVVYVIRLLRQAQGPLGQVSGVVGDLNDRLKPVLGNVEQASEQARQIATRLRGDADDVGDALRRATESTERMVDLVEDRVAEVAALMEVVQEEAEETFLSTASLLRGFRRKTKKVSAARRVTRALGRR